MNYAKFNSIYQGLTSVSRKVYNAVPIGESWTPAWIASEIGRTGTAPEMKIIQGCLTSLKDNGLISETPLGKFSRKAVKMTPVIKPEEIKVFKHKPAVTVIKAEPVEEETVEIESNIDKLASLAKRTIEVSNMLKILAADIENAALAIEEQNQARDKENAKIQQLVQLLKSLG
ncbi:hypothetical protein UFOVP274_61 [uncultured Caudovirales phage]|uniref:Uncharacterized protein n=1 Tax=uncultured Caudovirales phage TaxID=2100421 RepID=A0A6J5LKN7_9CAUD|nr:hypothetical protein UFOVP274_61 [uncultured Caudovirales phage]